MLLRDDMGFLDKIRDQSALPMAPRQMDPVCGMMVVPEKAAGKSEHDGKTVWFCSAGCKRQFDADPARFLANPGSGHHS